MKERWGTGTWLGKKWSSDENMVSLANGKVVRARDVRPLPDDQAFDKALPMGIRGTPNNPAAAEDLDDERIHPIPRAPVARPAVLRSRCQLLRRDELLYTGPISSALATPEVARSVRLYFREMKARLPKGIP